MSGSLAVTFCNNSYLTKLEIDKVRRTKPWHCKRLVDDVKNRSKENTPDLLLTSINSYHLNMNFAVVVNRSSFLDSNIKALNGEVETSVYMKLNKMSLKWTSQVPKR